MQLIATTRPYALLSAGALLLLFAGHVLADPPNRVARIAYLAGEVSFAPAGEESWHAAQLNRPLVAGDQLWTSRASRIELELGGVVFRLDEGSHFEFLSLNDQFVQAQLSEGKVNLRIDHVLAEQVYEVATPTLAFVTAAPGEFRLDVSADTGQTEVTVFDGHATVYGEDGNHLTLRAGSRYRFHTPGQLDHQQLAITAPDEFDRWAFARNQRYHDSASRQYVSTEMIGYSDLDHHGSWRHVSDYGHVWFPRRVVAGWAPYRHGHWSWIDPWGWTWVDDAPWGFAPFHYGRWVYVANGWGWVPGPRHLRPVYAPALVAFVGGSGWSLTVSSAGPPVGWFPLGPRDVYMPWYRCSRGYFSRVNVHNTYVFNNIYVTNIYNDYYVQGRPLRRDYTFRGAVNAVTVVPRDAFVGSRNVARSMARLRPGVIERGEILARAPATPTRASLAGGSERHGVAPPTRALNRSVIARNQPPARTVPFETRERAIARNGGEPLAMDQMHRLSAARGQDGARSVRVIGGDESPGQRPGRALGDRNTSVIDTRSSSRGSVSPERAGRGNRDAVSPTRAQSLPSARYSGRGDATSTARQRRAQPADTGASLPSQSVTPSSRVPTPRTPSERGAAPAREATPATRAPRGGTIAPTPAPRPTPSRSPRSSNDGIPVPRSSTSRSDPAAAPAVPSQRARTPTPRTNTPAPSRRDDTWSRPAAPAATPTAPSRQDRGSPRTGISTPPQTVPSRTAAPSTRQTPMPVQRSQAAPTRQAAEPAPARGSAVAERPPRPERGDRGSSRRSRND